MAQIELKLSVRPYYERKEYPITDGYFVNYFRAFLDTTIETVDQDDKVFGKGISIPSIPLCSCPGGHETVHDARWCDEAVGKWTNFVVNRS